LALGSGSARGWSHIGVLDALAKAGIEPDVVCGSSIGALVGAAYVTGRLPELKRWAEAATWREVIALLDIHLAGGGLIDGNLIVNFLRSLGIEQPIETCAKPYAAIATDLASGREIWLRDGPIEQAVRASIAIPGIICPAPHGERWLIDGGLVNPVPVSTCRALGAEFIIAVNLNGDLVGRRFQAEDESAPAGGPPPAIVERLLSQLPLAVQQQAAVIVPKLLRSGPRLPGYFDVLANSINIMQDQITRSRLAGEPPQVMLLPRLGHIGLLEFHRAREAIEEGEATVAQALASIRHYLA
jgi:NTE family protein